MHSTITASLIHHFPPLIQHSAFIIHHFRALATPTQEDVFKSIQTSVDEPSSSGKVLPFLMAGAAVIILLALFTQRRKREFAPKALNHQGKLLKEVLRIVPLRSAEVKQLKLLAESNRTAVTGPVSPLTLLLCPSLFARSLRNRAVKIDSKALAHLAKRVGVAIESQKKPAAARTAKPPAPR
jgi:hypothetical protein